MKNPWVIVGFITVILFGGAIWYSSSATEKNNEGVVVTDHIKGSAEATVTLVEFSDFQCPACASFQPVLEEVMKSYGEKISFEYKHYPLPIHPYAQQAALAAEAAGQQGKFYEYHDVLFKNQQAWSASVAPGALFQQYAKELGLDMEQFQRHQKSALLRDRVRGDMNEARELGLTGTPTFYLNGEKMEMDTFEEFITQIAMAVDPVGAAAMMASSTATSSTPATTGSDVKFGL
ncbi:MAG: thioredoxin domain-containing protein [Candidatus Pacebacteria bacterium]|nr:thioredoxin domain-containing protein [Candidatus Paceibacterota bacterium]MBP9842754.1 thioredoxin domain-containing protein [Candidatus Paceibacterota bacterium]